VREIRKHGSEGGEARVFPTPIDIVWVKVKAAWYKVANRSRFATHASLRSGIRIAAPDAASVGQPGRRLVFS